jgi:DNA (cytosine-5)-methyltransferase 1
MKHLSLFSGIGGLDLAAEWAGFETVAFVERDPYCQRVLGKRWPGVPILSDVRLVADAGRGRCGREGGGEVEQPGGAEVIRAGEICLVSGGFPCQPHSVAGKRQASADDRDLWPEVARVLREIRPRWFVGENVPGLLHSESGRFFGGILGDLADMGYRVGWGVWGAADVGALHRRERVFIVAYAQDLGHERAGAAWNGRDGPPNGGDDVADALGLRQLQPQGGECLERGRAGDCGEAMADTDSQRGCGGPAGLEDAAHAWESSRDSRERIWNAEPPVGRVADGVSGRAHRLRALGNAVVPQQAFPLFAEIARIERLTNVT